MQDLTLSSLCKLKDLTPKRPRKPENAIKGNG